MVTGYELRLTIYGFHFTLIETIEKRQGLKVTCVEEVAYRMGYIDANKVRSLAEPLCKNGYGEYLFQIIEEKAQVVDRRRGRG